MPLLPGTRLGPYEILAPLGAGGMGEVYKARDTRLDRLVAVKVLPEHLARDPEALARFEREAKAVAALNHPNIVGIFDFATHGETVCVVAELLEGEVLRARLKEGPVSPRRATELAVQMAQGLAAAHGKGVVHRDLKPDNLWITRDGRLKILDFGLAKQMAAPAPAGLTEALSQGLHTEAGMILGTLGYMSPEQVRGEAVDARADLFSFGAVLFEMLTGRRAFAGASAADTMAAILKEDPPELDDTSRPIPPGLRRIVDRCLEKTPARRFQNAEDLAFALENLATGSDAPAPFSAPFAPQNRRATWLWGAVAAAGAVLAVLGGWALRGGAPEPPGFTRLTFVPGTIETARFGPDGRTVYFSERIAGGRPELYVLAPGSTEPRPLGIKDALLLGVSANNDLAFIREPSLTTSGRYRGTLAQTPGGGGGALRELQEDISEAAWDGAGMATLSVDAEFRSRLEFPAGTVLFQGSSDNRYFSNLRLSPDGARLAAVDADAVARAQVVVFDRSGHRKVLFTKLGDAIGDTLTGLAWGPGGELWCSELQGDQTALWAVSGSGRRRPLWRSAGAYQLQDVSADGRVLMALHQSRWTVLAQRAGEAQPRDLSILGSTQAVGLSADGRKALLLESTSVDGGTSRDGVYLRPLDGGPPVKLGIGNAETLSADGRWVNVVMPPLPARELDPAWLAAVKAAGLAAQDLEDVDKRNNFALFIPTGLGRPFALAMPPGSTISGYSHLLPDGQRAVALASSQGKAHWFLLDRNGGAPKTVTREGLGNSWVSLAPISPDGTRLIVAGNRKEWFVQPVAGGEAQPIRGMLPLERVVGWAADGRAVFVRPELSVLPVVLTRLDLASGARTRIAAFTPADPAGHLQARGVFVSPDARAFLLTYQKKLSELYLVEGLR